MKRCAWCGSQYPDTVEQCPVDAQPLTGGEQPPVIPDPAFGQLTVPPAIPIEETPIVSGFPRLRLSDRQLRMFEVVLLCVVAFAGSILYSASFFLGLRSVPEMQANRSWTFAGLHELAALGLLWYILLRRSRSLSDLGMSWTKKDFAHSALVWLLGFAAYCVLYWGIYLAGLTLFSYSAGGARVRQVLFGGGITLMTFIFQFINPFYEELIVRAYVITEIRQLTNSVSKAVIASTLLQMSYHLYQGGPMAFSNGAAFLVFSIYYAKTNRITPLILAHLYMDLWATLAFMLHH